VGAPGEEIKSGVITGLEFKVGAAYVFIRSASEWKQQAYLKASNAGNSDEFGRSAAISGNTIVIGAPYQSPTGNGISGGAGAAYVFVFSDGQWTEQAILRASNAGVSDEFGAAVAVSEDTILVGAPGEDSNAVGVQGDGTNNSIAQAGAAYVFVREAGVWSQQAYLKASNNRRGPFGAGGAFGKSVAIEGNTLVVGAREENSDATGINGNGANNNAPGSGAAYVFVRSSGAWTQAAFVKASTVRSADQFGEAVALSGNTLVVLAPSADSKPAIFGREGAAYVYVREGNQWSERASFGPGTGKFGDFFGSSLGLSGDQILIGSMGDSSNATGVNADGTNESASRSGAAFLFSREGATWTQAAYIKAGIVDPRDEFGSSVAISGDTIVIGARGESSSARQVNGSATDNGAANAGAAYVFGQAGPPPLAAISLVELTAAGLRFSIPIAPGQSPGVEYSSDGLRGVWIDLGDLPVTDGTGTFAESDPIRSARDTGFYRVVLR